MSIIKNTEELNNLLDAVQKLPVKKDEQEKSIDITENGTTEVTPDEGKALSKVTVNVAIESGGGGTEEIENLIDESGVLDSTEGTIEEKINQLIEMAYVTGNIWTLRFPYNATLKDEIRIDCKKIKFLTYAFSGVKVKTIRLSNTQNVTDWGWAFGSNHIETIETIDFRAASAVNTQTFQSNNLKNIKFVPETIKVSISFASSSLLSDESIQSIIDGLATVEAAQTLTLNATVKEKLTEEQLATITNKNWNLA